MAEHKDLGVLLREIKAVPALVLFTVVTTCIQARNSYTKGVASSPEALLAEHEDLGVLLGELGLNVLVECRVGLGEREPVQNPYELPVSLPQDGRFCKGRQNEQYTRGAHTVLFMNASPYRSPEVLPEALPEVLPEVLFSKKHDKGSPGVCVQYVAFPPCAVFTQSVL